MLATHLKLRFLISVISPLNLAQCHLPFYPKAAGVGSVSDSTHWRSFATMLPTRRCLLRHCGLGIFPLLAGQTARFEREEENCLFVDCFIRVRLV